MSKLWALVISTVSYALVLGWQPAAAASDDAASFYKKLGQMKMVISARPGGSYDTFGRLLARHIGNQIPGKPRFIPVNIGGASGVEAANYVAKIAPKNGSIITNPRYNFAQYQALGLLEGKLNTKMSDFNWIGSFNATNHVAFTYHTSPVKTLEDAKKKAAIIGAASPRSHGTLMAYIYNAAIGTKFKVVTGYGGIANVKLAMQRGEVEGIGSDGWADLKSDFREMLENKQLNILIQDGLHKEPELPNVPLLIDLAKTPEEKALFLFIAKGESAPGKPFATSPGVPADRVALLRTAFDNTMKDAAFLKDANRINVLIRPLSGQEIQQIMVDIMSAPKSITDRLKAVVAMSKGKAKRRKKSKR